MVEAKCCSRNAEEKLFCASFAIDDLVLYLDTHPNDEEALKLLSKYVERENKLEDEINDQGTMIRNNDQVCDTGKWQWVCSPWPWEGV